MGEEMVNKIVIITGASSGFGKMLVEPFLSLGWNVIATMRNAEQRSDVFSELQNKFPGRIFTLSLDVTSNDERQAIFDFIERQFSGRLDCLINNAGYGVFGAIEDISEAQIRHQMEVNYFGTALLTRQLLPQLRRSKGRVINVTSVLGYVGMPLSSMYASSKFAVEGLSEALYYELKPHGVQVAIVEPGRFRTRFGENQQWGENSFADQSAYLSDSRAFAEYRARMAKGTGNPPDEVIEKIVNLAHVRTMPLRTRCGRDALLAHAIRKLLPGGLQTKLMAAVYGKMLDRRPR